MAAITSEVDSAATVSWLLWPSADPNTMPLLRLIDEALSEYALYTESDWSTFGWRPPEDKALLGAWKDDQGLVFVFLLSQLRKKSTAKVEPMIIQASGHPEAVDQVGLRIATLKKSLNRVERKELKTRVAESRILNEKKSPAFGRFMYFLTLLAAVVNALSYYLRKLPAPDTMRPEVQELYLATLLVIHFSALLFLLAIIVVGLLYVCRYGFLMIRRL